MKKTSLFVAIASSLLLLLGIGTIAFAGYADAYFQIGFSEGWGRSVCYDHSAASLTSIDGYTAKAKIVAYYHDGNEFLPCASADNTGADVCTALLPSIDDYTVSYAIGYFGTTQSGYLTSATAYSGY